MPQLGTVATSTCCTGRSQCSTSTAVKSHDGAVRWRHVPCGCTCSSEASRVEQLPADWSWQSSEIRCCGDPLVLDSWACRVGTKPLTGIQEALQAYLACQSDPRLVGDVLRACDSAARGKAIGKGPNSSTTEAGCRTKTRIRGWCTRTLAWSPNSSARLDRSLRWYRPEEPPACLTVDPAIYNLRGTGNPGEVLELVLSLLFL